MRSVRSPWRACMLPICLLAPAVAWSQQPAIDPLGFHAAPPLTLEPVGQTSVKAWYRALDPGRANDTAPWRQVIWFKNDPRTAERSCFAVVDFESGAVRELPTTVPALEVFESRWVGGRFYLGMNVPARLAVFDPATETLTDLGKCFADASLTCMRIEVSPDGMLVLAAGQGSDVSLYDPATGRFTHFGQVAAEPGGGTYAYSVSADEHFIYVAVRSSDPWELVRLDRKTKERTVLLTAPAHCHMAIHNNRAEVSGPEGKKWYTISDGMLAERPAGVEPPPYWRLPGPGFGGTPPRIAIDASPIVSGAEALAVHVQSPDGGTWRQARLPLRLDVADIGGLSAMDDGRLVAAPGAYFAIVVVDPASGVTQRFPLQLSMYGLLPVGRRIFISGYPSGSTMVFDTGRPMTWEEDLPDRAGVKADSAAANPRLLRAFGQDTGGAHIGMLLTRGADGNVYMIAKRHRYHYGFVLLWFDPEPDGNGEHAFTVYDDAGAFDHLQITDMRPVDDGRRLLITTEVQHNKQLPGEPPSAAAVLLFDVAEKRIVGRYEPLPGAKRIATAMLTGPHTLVGSADDYVQPGTGTLFRHDIRTGSLEQTRHVNFPLGGRMSLQPDGKVWGSVLWGNFSVVFTIDPKTLATEPLGRTEDARPHIGLCFHRGDLYLSGFPTVMKATGLPLPPTPPSAGP
jgi:hypothetical protein